MAPSFYTEVQSTVSHVFFLLSRLQRMLAGKKFSIGEEVIAGIKAYIESKDKLYDNNGIKKLNDLYVRRRTSHPNC